MDRKAQTINERYEALMFAGSSRAAQKAARELVRLVLGEEAVSRPLDETLRQVCRTIRPSKDPKEQARFESEFVELAMAPGASHQIAA
jgi:hypothetical protein